jgi:DNA-binding CsgD family transcriptional regulator
MSLHPLLSPAQGMLRLRPQSWAQGELSVVAATEDVRPSTADAEPVWIVFKLDPIERLFRASETRGLRDSASTLEVTFRMGEERGLVGLVAARNRPLHVPNVRTDARWVSFDDSHESGYLTPLSWQGQVLGVLVLAKRTPLDATHRALADSFAQERAKLWSQEASAPSSDGEPAETSGRPDLSSLSQRERDVVNALCRGLRLTEIARVLGISSHTARNHLKHVFRKLGVHSQVELLSWIGRPQGVP